MLTVRDIRHQYDKTPVLRDVDLDVRDGEIICLLGESGSGKTTLLRIIAGIEQGYGGKVLLNGQPIDDAPTHKRGFGLMFQEFALFPHMNVGENIAFGLKMRRQSAKEQQKAVASALELVGLRGFEKRDVSQLSGGERQRVALARSLAPEPRLLMLDEPMGSLDAALRDRLVIELRHIIKDIGLTAIYVTHDQQEAYAIADRIAVMNAGRIEQIDTPQRLYHHPKTAFVARFLGLTNIVPVQHFDDSQRQAQTPIGNFAMDKAYDALLLHPDGLHIINGEAAESDLTATMRECVFRGRSYRLSVRVSGKNDNDEVDFTFHVPSLQNLPAIGETIRLRAQRIIGLSA